MQEKAASQEKAPLRAKFYTVQEVSRLAGVSVRTLHLYDEIELLKPASRTEYRYRLYGEKELLRLQQILFYKELDFSLQEIQAILDAPDFDIVQALEQHKTALLTKQTRLGTLLETIDKTIQHITYNTQGDTTMSYQMTAEELYEGLPKEFGTDYRTEAQKRWSEDVKRSEEALRKMSKADFAALKDEFKQNWLALASMTAQDPTSDAVQQRILRHYTLTRTFWGTSTFADKQAAQFKALGQMYTEDPRFTVTDGKPNPDFAAFLKKAMAHFAETALG